MRRIKILVILTNVKLNLEFIEMLSREGLQNSVIGLGMSMERILYREVQLQVLQKMLDRLEMVFRDILSETTKDMQILSFYMQLFLRGTKLFHERISL